MVEDVLKTKISREVLLTIATLLSKEDLTEVTDGRGVYIPFSRSLRDAIGVYLAERELPLRRRTPDRPLAI